LLDLSLFLTELLVVLAAARLAGRLAALAGQPQVVGEMAAGLALGPSVFGAVAPRTAAALFPAERLAPLAALSQLGVVLFMFVVGLRLDFGLLRGRARAAVATSHASMAVPFALGVAITPQLYPALAGAGVPAKTFALFVGVAMSVTAFPVLARILAERGLLGTRVGAVAIASAAVDDVTAWCLLAGVIAVARAGSGLASAAAVLAAVALYAVGAIVLGRRVLARLFAPGLPNAADVTVNQVGLAALIALASALVTERLGVHALFGAFLAGAVMPRRGDFSPAVADRLDAVVTTVLLPIFFAFTGLRTSVALVSGAALWRAGALVLAAAVVGKLVGSAVPARVTGMTWREALSVGVLMNTRGLMELVVLNVALDAGVISPALFAVMVLMAFTTTAMTSPLLSLLRVTVPRVAVT
jgi:Kef-type K+ transport system membrane component KefB